MLLLQTIIIYIYIGQQYHGFEATTYWSLLNSSTNCLNASRSKISSYFNYDNKNIPKQFRSPKSNYFDNIYLSSFHMHISSSIRPRGLTKSPGTRRNAFLWVGGHQFEPHPTEYCDLTELLPFLAMRSYENPLLEKLRLIQLTMTALPRLYIRKMIEDEHYVFILPL